MFKLKDYIFYRMCIAFEKKNEWGRGSAVLYFVLLEHALILPFLFLLHSWLEAKTDLTSNFTIGAMIFVPMVLLEIANMCRYNKKRCISLIFKYRNSKYNKTIKQWMFTILLAFAVFWGIFGVVILGSLFKLIFCNG